MIGSREHLLAAILAAPLTRERQDWKPNVLVLHSHAIIDHDLAKRFPDLARRHTPVSDHLSETLRPWLSDLQPDQEAFERALDRFEYLLGLVMFDLRVAEGHSGWAPVGRFSWRGRYGNSVDAAVESEIAVAGGSWPLLQAGAFGGDVARLAESRRGWREHVDRVRSGLW